MGLRALTTLYIGEGTQSTQWMGGWLGIVERKISVLSASQSTVIYKLCKYCCKGYHSSIGLCSLIFQLMFEM
jgi:hypothetical protein